MVIKYYHTIYDIVFKFLYIFKILNTKTTLLYIYYYITMLFTHTPKIMHTV